MSDYSLVSGMIAGALHTAATRVPYMLVEMGHQRGELNYTNQIFLTIGGKRYVVEVRPENF